MLFHSLSLTLLFTAPLSALAARTVTVVNQCPDAITLIVDQSNLQTIQPQGTYQQTLLTEVFHTFQTPSYGGGSDIFNGTYAYFDPAGWYFISQFSDNFNTAVKIEAHPAQAITAQSPCGLAECAGPRCLGAFGTREGWWTSPNGVPYLPLHRCDQPNVDYIVTYCSGERVIPVQIHPTDRTDLCLTVQGTPTDGSPIIIDSCTGNNANQKWVYNRDRTHVQLFGTNQCLDAGSTPQDGTRLKTWTCYDNLPAQDWFKTADYRIALNDRGKCIDLVEGSTQVTTPVQIWGCSDGNMNQWWSFTQAG